MSELTCSDFFWQRTAVLEDDEDMGKAEGEELKNEEKKEEKKEEEVSDQYCFKALCEWEQVILSGVII